MRPSPEPVASNESKRGEPTSATQRAECHVWRFGSVQMRSNSPWLSTWMCGKSSGAQEMLTEGAAPTVTSTSTIPSDAIRVVAPALGAAPELVGV